MEIQSFPELAVPSQLRDQVLRLRAQAWPSHDARQWSGHDPALRPVSMLLIEDGMVLAALDILSKDLVHRAQSYAVSGLSTVVTDRDQRGKGLGRRLVSVAREEIRRSGADLGLFTCDRPLQPFYESAGWSCLLDTVLVGGTPQEPFASDQFDKVTMAGFFSTRAVLAAETFHHCRVELYPGDRDKLW